MRLFRIAAVVVITSVTLGASPGTATVPLQRAAAVPRRPFVQGIQRATVTRRRNGTTCTENASQSFVGIPGASNVAGGSESAVLGGTNNEACDSSSAIAGGEFNDIGNSGSAQYSFIGGGSSNTIGGTKSAIGGGGSNSISGTYAFIGGGALNEASANDVFIGAGFGNVALGTASFMGAGGSIVDASCPMCAYFNEASGIDSFVGAGDMNLASGNGSFVGAGGYTFADTQSGMPPSNVASGEDSFVGAGDSNVASSLQGFIGAGQSNTIAAAATAATIVGGAHNAANGAESTIGGGYGNIASGSYATIPGGYDDEALGELSFAAGYHAYASHSGSFVWSDYVSGSPQLKDAAADQFLVRASGGTILYSNEAMTAGVKLAAGSGTWANLSDRSAKAHIVPLDERTVLARLESLPIGEWRYRGEAGARHAGPMAQDFYAAFGLGDDDRHIATIDEGGVALASAAALDRDDVALGAANARLAHENERMRVASRALLAKLVLARNRQANVRDTFARLRMENDRLASDDERLLSKLTAIDAEAKR